MLLLNEAVETPGLRSAAEHICVAARTVTKGRDKDLLGPSASDNSTGVVSKSNNQESRSLFSSLAKTNSTEYNVHTMPSEKSSFCASKSGLSSSVDIINR